MPKTSDKYSDSEASVRSLLATLIDLARGSIESIRLSSAERLTLLLAAIAVAAIATILGTAVIFFLSVGAAHVLATVTPLGAYFIIAGFYAVLLVALFIFRRTLIVDPVARLITRLLVSPPDELQSTPTNTARDDKNDQTPD